MTIEYIAEFVQLTTLQQTELAELLSRSSFTARFEAVQDGGIRLLSTSTTPGYRKAPFRKAVTLWAEMSGIAPPIVDSLSG